MNVLAITNLFPNQYEPRRGLFNLRQLKRLSKHVSLTVIAPIPTFIGMGLFPKQAASGRVGRSVQSEVIEGIPVHHPRYFYTPKIARWSHGYFYYLSTRGIVTRMNREQRIDAILSTWAFPDVFGSHLVARKLGIPFFAKVHGSDINDYMAFPLRRRMIVGALNSAVTVISVSEALKKKMVENGVGAGRIEVVYNGVDLELFFPVPREQARAELALDDTPRILFVGNLKPVKGVPYLIDALRILLRKSTRCHLHIIGFGPLESALRKQVSSSGIADHVTFEGETDDVRTWMNACDVLCLPSVSEGVPNVVLEALACGTPVVASNVGGIAEVVNSGNIGTLIAPRDPEALAAALENALETEWDRAAIARRAKDFGWDRSSDQLSRLIKTIEPAGTARC